MRWQTESSLSQRVSHCPLSQVVPKQTESTHDLLSQSFALDEHYSPPQPHHLYLCASSTRAVSRVQMWKQSVWHATRCQSPVLSDNLSRYPQCSSFVTAACLPASASAPFVPGCVMACQTGCTDRRKQCCWFWSCSHEREVRQRELSLTRLTVLPRGGTNRPVGGTQDKIRWQGSLSTTAAIAVRKAPPAGGRAKAARSTEDHFQAQKLPLEDTGP